LFVGDLRDAPRIDARPPAGDLEDVDWSRVTINQHDDAEPPPDDENGGRTGWG
jgi:hypothetical protein